MSSPSTNTFSQLIAAKMGISSTPAGWRPLIINNSDGEQQGFLAQAYKNDTTGQIVIAIQGPGTVPGVLSEPTPAVIAAAAVNLKIAKGEVPTDYQNAATFFLEQVIVKAGAEGFSVDSSNTFVTGNSLGGYGAQYLASQNNFGGASFGGPGVLGIAPNPTQNFKSYVNKGDAIANAASDTGINWPGASYGPHYGSVEMLGSQTEQNKLAGAVQILSNSSDLSTFLGANGFILGQTKLLHDFTYYQQALGLDPTPPPPQSNDPPVPNMFYAPWGQPINAPDNWTLDSDGNEILKVNGIPVLTIPQDAQVDYADATHKVLKITDPVDGGGTIESTLAFASANVALVTATDVSGHFDWMKQVTAVHPDGLFDKIVIGDNNAPTSASYSGAQVAGNIGALFGSRLGTYLGGNSLAAQLAAGTVLGAIGGEIGKALTMGASYSLDVSVQNAFGTLAGGSGVGSLPSGAIAAVSSLLMSELADTLNLSGFEGGLFTTVGTTITSQLVTNAYGMMTGATVNGQAYTMFTGFDSGAIVGQLEASVGGYLGSQLAGHVVIPHYAEGAVGQQIGSAVGGLLGSAIVPVIGGFIGSFIGSIVGSLAGDLAGNDPESHGRVVFFTDGRFYPDPTSFWGDHGANGNTFMNIATYTGQTVNALADYAGVTMSAFPVDANPISNAYGLQLLYTQDNNYFTINEPFQGPLSTVAYPQSAAELSPLINTGIMTLVHRVTVAGGDPLVRLAWQNSQADNPTAFSFDLQVAKDYRLYLDDKPMIDALIAAEPESAFTAGWIVTLLKAHELGLDAQPASEDFRAGNDNLNGTAAADLLVGGAGNDSMWGGDGNDRLRGGSGDDAAFGENGNDILLGEAGNDWLIGGFGNDWLDGGPGSDRAVFGGARAAYTIAQVGGNFRISGPNGVDDLIGVEFAVFDDTTVALVVNDHAPAITGGAAASVALPENTSLVTTVIGSDPDPGTTLTYAISGGADAARFQINPASGALSFIAPPDFEHPADADHNNSYLVNVRASDGLISSAEQAITVNVGNVREVWWAASVEIGGHPMGWWPRAIGDFNADGTSDVLWYNPSNNAVRIWKVANAHWAGDVEVGAHPPGWVLAPTGDFNHDGTADVLWYAPGNGDAEVWKFQNGQWAASVEIGLHPPGWQPAGAGDFNADGTDDMLWFNAGASDIDVWMISNAQWAGSVHTGAHPGGGWQPVGTGDFDHDGTDDLFWYNPATGGVDIWKIANGQWAASFAVGPHPAGWVPAGIGDFNADGTSDIAWFNGATGNVDLWLISNGHWTASMNIGSHPAGWSLDGIGDFNHDGVSDILWREVHNNTVETWLLATG